MQLNVHVYPIFRCEVQGVACIPTGNAAKHAEAIEAAAEKAEQQVMETLNRLGGGFQVGNLQFSYADDLDDSMVDLTDAKGVAVESVVIRTPQRKRAEEHVETLKGLIDGDHDDLGKMLLPIQRFLEAL